MELKFQIAINAALGELGGSCESGAPVSLQEQPLFGGHSEQTLALLSRCLIGFEIYGNIATWSVVGRKQRLGAGHTLAEKCKSCSCSRS